MTRSVVEPQLMYAVAELLPEIKATLDGLQGSGCEAASQRAYQQGRFDMLTHDIWTALGLRIPPELAGMIHPRNGEGGTHMGYPEPEAADVLAEATADDAAETAEAADADAAEAETDAPE